MDTIGGIIRTRAVRLGAFVAGAAAATAIVPSLLGFELTPTDYREPPPTRVERLIERHDCWTERAPGGVVPARAVVTLPGERPRTVSADVGFAIWLEGAPGRLHAFCR